MRQGTQAIPSYREVVQPSAEKVLGVRELVAMASGMVISSAVFSLVGPATAFAGRATWIAYICAVIAGFITIIPNLMITGAVVLRGGDYTLTKIGLGKLASGLFIWNFVVMNVAFSISASSLSNYITSLWPQLPGKQIAIACVVGFFLLNIMPIRAVSRAQNVMFFLMMTSFAVYILFGFTRLQPGVLDIAADGYFRQGLSGFGTAVSTLVFSTTAYVSVMAAGGQAKRPRRDIPIAMTLTGSLILVLYTLMALVASNTLPIESVAGLPLTATARQMLPFGLFVFFMVCGPFLAVSTTLNSGFYSCALPYAQATKDGWLPKFFSYRNRFGAPVWCVCIVFVATLAPLLLTDDVVTLANSATLISYLVRIVTLVACWTIPVKYPQYWKSGAFGKMKRWTFYLIMTVCSVVQLGLIGLSMAALTTTQVAVSLGCLAVLSAVCIIWYTVRKNRINVAVKETDML